MKKDITTVTTTSIKIITTKFFGQCWNQDYICGCTDCAKLENKGEELVQCKIQKLWKFCSEVCKRIGDCKTWNKGGKFPFCKIYILHSLPKFSIVQCCAIYLRFIFSHLQRYLHLLIGWVVLELFPSQLFVTNCTFLTRTAPPL